MSTFRRKSTSAILLITAAIILMFFGWRHFTKPKPWSDERNAEGAVYSLATGTHPDVGEIAVAGGFLRTGPTGFSRVICCYDVKTGRILWENKNWFEIQESEAGPATHEIFVSGYDFHHYSSGRVRCRDTRRWLSFQSLDGTTREQHCFRLVLTPSGRAVMARDPNDRHFTEPLHHWQVTCDL